jgi:hypothetical protein
MTTNKEPDSGHDRMSPEETRESARAVAARKAARTRRDQQARREAEIRRRIFLVTNGDDVRERYGPVYSLLLNSPDQTDPTGHFTLDDVIADVEGRFDFPTIEDAEEGDGGVGFGSEDVAVWRDGRIRAVVHRGADGKPEVTRFSATDHDRAEGSSGSEG